MPSIEDVSADEAGRERLQLMYDAAQRLLMSEDPTAFLRELYPRLAEHLGLEVYVHHVADEASGRLRLAAYSGISEKAAESLRSLNYGEAVCGHVAALREPIIANHIQQSDDPLLARVREINLTAYACHPLLSGDRLVGTLSFGTGRTNVFSEDAIALMRSVADQVAVAIDRWQSRQALRAINQTLEQRIAERTRELTERTAELRQLATDLTHAEQRERRRLAELLHDHLQQLMVAAKLKNDLLLRRLRDETDRRLAEDLNTLLDESIAATRTLTAELHPVVLYRDGLIPALRWLGQQMASQHGLQVSIDAPDDAEPHSEDVRVVLFHATREVLFNVVKHAGVDEASVRLERNGDGVAVTVRDEGSGFDPALIDHTGRSGLGLHHLRDRLALVGGSLDIDSAEGRGSRIRLNARDKTPTEA